MAGTSAVFIPANFASASPVERDGLVWSDAELHMPDSPQPLAWKPPLDTSLALEGLEEYEPPASGDARYIKNLGMAFVYNSEIRGWVALTDYV
ncbi:hypothetical protein FY115_15000 [Cellvibrio japonicus]|nr:hypothetical protein FY117_15000 [Cellvibrio japonicus]QEI17847.1 hypothetical protein FY116_15005 [Cellvibrio japonicus]QEI21422.1 hypothetical protein FY115_15000 [Cellvibrio japonicus]